MVSFNVNVIGLQMINAIFISRLLIFYETNVGLSIGLIGIGYSIYTIWDAFNEPFSGYLSDRPNRLWRRWGKRYPWIIFSFIPIALSFFLIFIPPDPKVNEWATFLWFVGILCLYDAVYSIWKLNYHALIPDKFRSAKERTKVSAIRIPFHVGGLLIGLILPSLIIEYEDQASYLTMSIVVTIILIIVMVISLTGIREDEIMRVRAINTAKQEREPFFKNLKKCLKHKNFRVWIIAGIVSYAWDALVISSIPYYIQYVLRLDPDAEIFIYLAYLLGSVISVPLWTKLIKKHGHWKIFKIALCLNPLPLIPLIFTSNLLSTVIFTSLLGVIIGGNNVALFPTQSNMMDEAAIIHGERHDGRYNGIYTFVSKAGQYVQIIVIVILHYLTNFDPTPGAVQSDLALLGIRFQLALAPVILATIQALVYIIWWDLTPEKVKTVESRLKELNL